jgi:hypothetical protein
VVYAHLVDAVERWPQFFGRARFWVDENGILRHRPPRRWSWF